MNAVFYGLAILICPRRNYTRTVRFVSCSIRDTYAFMPHSSSILRYELCIYEDLQSAHQNENTGLSRFLSAKSLNRFQTEDNSPRSIMLGLHYFTSLVALRVDQRLPIWCATRVQSPGKICLFLRHRPSDCKLAKDIISRWRLLGLVLCLDQSQIDTCATQGPVRELERSIGH